MTFSLVIILQRIQTESFSQLARTCSQHGAWLMIDDAHGIGVLGKGKGALAEYNLSLTDVPVYMATLGKALGSYGAFVAGDDDLIDFLIQFCRSYIYTTAMPPAIAAASLAALDLMQTESWRIEHLQQRIAYFRAGAVERKLPILKSDTAIQPILVGDSRIAVEISELLRKQGVLVGAIRPPTVPAGTARLRVTLQSEHRENEIDRLLDTLAHAFKQFELNQE